ncbi:DUF975 family protein [Lacrimispora celerecrescens]|uniref:DUF975 family protein n=1 Tax=Lacrimispora celerecrescens TaxID=29354 RepID=UPI0016469973|nr:DUF975 family protein [Lacrimispora celerecrescens]
MKTSSSELKSRAKRSLKGRYGLCIGIQFIEGAILLAITLVYILTSFSMGLVRDPFINGGSVSTGNVILKAGVYISFLIILSVYGLLKPGVLKIYMDICNGNAAKLSDLLFAFQNKPHRFLGLYFINLFIGFAWGIPYFVVLIVAVITDFIPVMVVLLVLTYLLLLIGNIITMLYLSQSMFLLIESPDQRVFGSLKESAAMMKGNKGGYFYLFISFIGMVVLGYCSMGIGLLWIVPYIQATMTEYYLDLKERLSRNSHGRGEEVSFESMWSQENQW